MEIYKYVPDAETERKIRLRGIWYHMRTRCYNPHYEGYHRYGGRGITICDEWVDDFDAFYEWAIKHGYEADLSIDRIDNDKGYSPDNCRFASHKEQSNNTSSNHLLTLSGETHSIAEWSEKLGINQSTLSKRVVLLGWSDEKALTKEVNRKNVRRSEE